MTLPVPRRHDARMRTLAFALVAALGWAAAPPPRPAAADDLAEWTVLYYLDGDTAPASANDGAVQDAAEAALCRTLNEVLGVPVTDASRTAIRLFAVADRPSQDSGELVDGQSWSWTRLVELVDGHLVPVVDPDRGWPGSSGAPQATERSMGEAETLRDALVVATSRAPARRLALVMMGHGAAWQGLGYDQAPAPPNDPDTLDVVELSEALRQARAATGRAVDLLVLESCFMGSLEVADALAPDVRYLVASQDLVWAEDFSHAAVVAALRTRPTMDAAALGTQFVQRFGNPGGTACDRERPRSSLSLLDLAHVTRSVGHLAEFVEALRRSGDGTLSTDARRWFFRTRSGVRYFRPSCDESTRRDCAEFDLAGLMRRASDHPDAAVAAAARAVVGELRAAEVCTSTGPENRTVHGLSVFVACDGRWIGPAAHDPRLWYANTRTSDHATWYGFLRELTASGCEPSRTRVGRVLLCVLEYPWISATARVLEGRSSVQRAWLRVAEEDESAHVEWPAAVAADGTVSGAWDGSWFVLQADASDGSARIGLDVLDAVGDAGEPDGWIAAAPAVLQDGKGWRRVTLRLWLERTPRGVEGRVLGAVAALPPTGKRSPSVRVTVPLPAGAVLRTLPNGPGGRAEKSRFVGGELRIPRAGPIRVRTVPTERGFRGLVSLRVEDDRGASTQTKAEPLPKR